MLLQEEEGAEGARPRGYRQQREADQRADAGNRVAWNTLFMRPDTVAEAVAAHYGVSKSQLLDRDAAGAHPLNLRHCLPPRGCKVVQLMMATIVKILRKGRQPLVHSDLLWNRV